MFFYLGPARQAWGGLTHFYPGGDETDYRNRASWGGGEEGLEEDIFPHACGPQGVGGLGAFFSGRLTVAAWFKKQVGLRRAPSMFLALWSDLVELNINIKNKCYVLITQTGFSFRASLFLDKVMKRSFLASEAPLFLRACSYGHAPTVTNSCSD